MLCAESPRSWYRLSWMHLLGCMEGYIAHLRRRYRVLGAAGVGRLHARRRATLREHARLPRLIHNLDGARGSGLAVWVKNLRVGMS